jgi:hypothetical protein
MLCNALTNYNIDFILSDGRSDYKYKVPKSATAGETEVQNHLK